jgi:hypothetical protein
LSFIVWVDILLWLMGLKITPAYYLLQSAPIGITRVQSKTGNSGNATTATVTITLDAAATIGNTLIFAVCTQSGPGHASYIHGSSTDFFVAFHNDATGLIKTGIGYCPVQEASATITLTLNTASYHAYVAVEYSGISIGPDIMPFGAVGSSTTNTTPTLATTNYPNELIVAAMGTRGSWSSAQTAWLTSPTNSFTSVGQTSSFTNLTPNDRAVAFLERIVTSTGAYSTAGTQANNRYSNQIASFFESAAIGGGAY